MSDTDRSRRSLAVLAALSLLSLASPAHAVTTFQGLGFLPGGNDSRGLAVSGDGSVVVGSSQSSGGTQAFRWTRSDGMVALGTLPGGSGSTATAVSHDGSVIVGRSSVPGGFEAFRWTEAGGMQSIGDLPGGLTQAIAWDVSADGSVVVGNGTESPTGGVEGWIWTESAGMQSIESTRTATAIAGDGQIVVGRGATSPGLQAMRWTAETGAVLLGDLATDASPPGTDAQGISADGRVLVGSSSGNGAVSWTEDEGWILLPNPDGTLRGYAEDASGDGSVIVGAVVRTSGSDYYGAAIWDAQGARLLEDVITQQYGIDLGGWRLTSAQAISDDGHVIVGIGVNPSGVNEGFVLIINPEPSTGSMLALGLVGLAARQRTRRARRR